MPIAAGVAKSIRFKKQTGLGAVAPGGAATGKLLRRVSGSLDLKKEQYKSAEIRTSMQRADSRHGVRSVDGSLSGELSPGSYQEFFESLLRQAAQIAATTGPQSLSAVAATGFARAAGSFVADGLRVGSVVRAAGFATTGVGNNGRNFLVTSITALTLNGVFLDGGAAVAAVAAAAGVTIAEQGKKTFIPTSGHSRDYYTFEEWFSDLGQSEQYQDVVVSTGAIKMPATGIPTVEFGLMGLNQSGTGAAQYFTSPTAAGNGGLLTSASGALYINGTKYATVTGFEVNVNGNFTRPGGVVGSNVDPDLFPGVIEVSGQMTALFDSVTLRDAFINETVCTVSIVLTTGTSATADFVAVTLTNLKFGGSDVDDGEKGLVLTLPFIASEDTSGTAGNPATTITIQDSLFV